MQEENCCDNVFSLQVCFLPKLETTWCVVINDPQGKPKGILAIILILNSAISKRLEVFMTLISTQSLDHENKN